LKRRGYHLYSIAQKLYPAPFRAAYSKEQLQTLTDMLDHAGSSPERLLVWLRVWTDLAPSIVVEQINYQGTLFMNETPKFLKTASIISALMLVPFLLAISANAIDRLVFHHNLYNSWLWHFPFLGLWVVWLPQAALLIALVSFIAYLVQGHDGGWLHRALNLHRTWIIVLPGLIALGIMFLLAFHDSVQCLKVSPAYLVTHTQSVYRCVVKNDSLPGFRKFY
jgi:hypothetical protein